MTSLGANLLSFVTLNLFQGPWPDIAAWAVGAGRAVLTQDELLGAVK
jgi:hypothetical protein